MPWIITGLSLLLAGGAAVSLYATRSTTPDAMPAPITASALAPRPTNPYTTLAADLPPAPPLESWVVKGSDFQQTLDLNMQANMIDGLKMPTSEATVETARALAYHVCSGARAGKNPVDLVVEAYPSTPLTAKFGLMLAAEAYCLDTV